MAQGSSTSKQTNPRKQQILTNTDLTVDGDITLTGEINGGLVAKLNNLSTTLAQITNGQGYIAGDLYVRGQFYSNLAQMWFGPISPTLGATEGVAGLAADGAGNVMLVGDSGSIDVSQNDGQTWTAATSCGVSSVANIGYGLGTWVVVGGSAVIAISTNFGTSWTTKTVSGITGTPSFNCILTDGNGTWVAGIGFGASGGQMFAYSKDNGVTWFISAFLGNLGAFVNPGAAYGKLGQNNLFVFNAGPFGTSGIVVLQGDPALAASYSFATLNNIQGQMGLGNGVAVAQTTNGHLWTSSDGFNWTDRGAVFAGGLFGGSMVFGRGAFIATVYDTTNHVSYYSLSQDNGKTWGAPALFTMFPNGAYVYRGVYSRTNYIVGTRQQFVVAGPGYVGYTRWLSQLDSIVTAQAAAVTGPTLISSLTIGATVTPPGMGTNTQKGTWLRVGTKMHMDWEINVTVAGTNGSGVYLIPIPAGYTIDTSQYVLDDGSSYNGTVVGTAMLRDGTAIGVGQVAVFSSTQLVIRDIFNMTTPAVGSPNYWSSTFFIFSHTIQVSFKADFHISQWTANINLATSFTEYASNSSSTDADDTTSFVYGSQGSVGIIGVTALTAERKKRVQFQNPIQSTDLIVIEFYDPTAAIWVSGTLSRGTGAFNVIDTGFVSSSVAGGVTMAPVNSTQIDVQFWNTPSGGSTLWNNAIFTGVKWRVRKTSNGNFAEQTYQFQPVELPRDTTNGQAYNGTGPANGAFTTANQVTGLFGVPAGVRGVFATVLIQATYAAGANFVVAFSDNNTSTPSGTTRHRRVGFSTTSASFFAHTFQTFIPLNSSGQFYVFGLSISGLTSPLLQINIDGYYPVGGILT